LREARFIYPADGPLNQAMQDALHKLKTMFGGATIYPATGYWANSGELMEENVRVADIAYNPCYATDCALYALAQEIRKASNQIEVYLRYGNGHVQFVSEHSLVMDNGEELPTEDIEVPDFVNMIDAVVRLVDEHTPVGERVAAFEYMTRSLQKGSLGNHRLNAVGGSGLAGAGADWGISLGTRR
jgi:hypothetical protein